MRSGRGLVASLSIGVAVAACGGAAKTSPHGGASAPVASASASSGVVDLDALDRRETSAALPPRHVTLPTPAVAFDVASADPPQIGRVGNSTKVAFSIGTKLPIDCYFFDSLDAGATAKALVDTAKEKIRPLGFDFLDVAVANGTPVLFLSSPYFVEQGGTRAAGRLKLALYSAFRVGFYCLQDELGYRDSFRRTIVALAESIVLPVEPNGTETARFVRVAKLRGHVIGALQQRIFDQGATTTSVANGAMIFPIEGGGLGVADLAEVTTYDGAGVVVEETDVHLDPSSPPTKLHVLRDAPKSYRVDGETDRRPVDLKLSGVDLTTDASRSRAVREFLASPKAEATFFAFDPDRDPGKPVELGMKKVDGGWIEVTTRDGRRRTRFDDRGYALVEESLDGTPIVIERIFPR